MSASGRWGAIFLLFSALFAPALDRASDAKTSNPSAQPSTATDTAGTSDFGYLEPEIVRLTYVQGDVRLAPPNGKTAIGQTWVQAQPGIPLEQGYTVATGSGRAEIELQDNSVIYLADSSTLLFESLLSFGGAPHTTLQLVSGTVTIDAHPLPNSGTLVIETPSTNRISITYPEAAFLRLGSYVDGMRITPQQVTTTRNNGGPVVSLRAGQSVTYTPKSMHVTDASAVKPPDNWDQWVRSQMAARQTDMQAALKASGLTEPVPGLIELYKTGRFSPCAPYGTCWQPTQATASIVQQSTQAPGTAQPALPGASARPLLLSGSGLAGKNAKPIVRAFPYSFEPCMTAETYERWDPQTRKWYPMQQTLTSEEYWDWAACGAGSWIHSRRGNFVLVLRKRKHPHPPRPHPPVRWVRVGNKTGFVPLDPRDKRGRKPINLKYGLFVPGRKANDPVKLVEVDLSKRVRILSGPPKSIAQISSALAPARRPVIETRALNYSVPSRNAPASIAIARNTRVSITYDYKKNSFVSSGGAGFGSHPTSGVVAKLDYRGPSPRAWTIWTEALARNTATGSVGSAGRSGGYSRGAAVRSSGAWSGRSGGGSRGYSGGGGRASSGRSGGGGGGYSGGGGRSYSGGGGFGGGGSFGGGGGGGARGGGGGGGGGRR